ncbi:hypothetical protein ACYOEI_17835 [Singulisphaera rosea]
MSTYAKTAPGERLTYRPADLQRYAGEQFCLRITPEDIDLDRCFFVYLDERFESESIRKLFQDYFFSPGHFEEAEMASWLEPWLHMDPMLPKKRWLLRTMFTKAHQQSGSVRFYINHGPGPINPADTVRSHLGTSVFDDGSFDDKILDVVLEFHVDGEPLRELDQWAMFRPTDTSPASPVGSGFVTSRRSILLQVVSFMIAIFTLPLMLYGCRGRMNRFAGNRNINGANGGGGGFFGGML